jgi:hypothetical protein
MSDPLAERLSRFTPDSAGLDRDSLLFGAGRLAARPNRPWQALAVVLAAAQVLTLLLLWPRPGPPTPPEPAPPAAAPAEPVSPSGREVEPWFLSRQMLEGQNEKALPAASLVADEPPLRVFAVPLNLLD